MPDPVWVNDPGAKYRDDIEALEAALAAAEAERDRANNDRGLLIQTQRSLTERAVAAEARCGALVEVWTLAKLIIRHVASGECPDPVAYCRAALGDAGGGTGEP